MALVVICGQPCSGKSKAAVMLVETLKESETKQNVRIIDEASFHLERNQSYANMPAEKNLRGKLRSDVDRSVSRGDIVIVDSLNSIKGYRYELWCIAHAAGIRYYVLYCDVDEAHCRQWNKERSDRGEASYDDGIFEDLVRRFDKPERRNRWDSPLFELYPSRDGINKSSPVISEAVTYLTKTVDSQIQDVRILQPSIVTQSARLSEANSLYELDRATQEVIYTIVEQQALGGAMCRVSLGNELPPIRENTYEKTEIIQTQNQSEIGLHTLQPSETPRRSETPTPRRRSETPRKRSETPTPRRRSDTPRKRSETLTPRRRSETPRRRSETPRRRSETPTPTPRRRSERDTSRRWETRQMSEMRRW